MKQVTYPRIEVQTHPEATGKLAPLGCQGGEVEPDERDLSLAQECSDFFQTVRKETASGEWKWININKKPEYIKSLYTGDVNRLARIFANMFRDKASYGIISADFQDVNSSPEGRKRLENHILLDLDVWQEFTEQNDLAILDMPRIGNPYGIIYDHVLISVDTPRHDYFALKIKELAGQTGKNKPVVLEIGGGYGGLFLQLTRHDTNIGYVNCDLPETLCLAYYFLKKATNKKISLLTRGVTESDISKNDAVFVPSLFAQEIACNTDIVYNCHSLSEMGRETIEQYFHLIHKLQPTYFYHQNSNFILFPNSVRHIEIPACSFPLDKKKYQQVYMALSPWLGGGGRYREFLFKRQLK